MVSKFAKKLLPSLLMASVGVAQDNGPTRPERPWPDAVELADVRMTGELSKRLMARLRWGEQSLTLRQKTGYPWAGDMRLEVTAAQGEEPRTLSLFTPSWAERPILKLSGQVQSVASQGGFLNVSHRWQAGDVVELSFDQCVAAKAPVNRVNGADRGEYHTFHYGPLMLGYAGPKAVTVKSDARFSRRGERDFLVEGTDLVLQPIYHLLDPAVSKNRGYRRQILFP